MSKFKAFTSNNTIFVFETAKIHSDNVKVLYSEGFVNLNIEVEAPDEESAVKKVREIILTAKETKEFENDIKTSSISAIIASLIK